MCTPPTLGRPRLLVLPGFKATSCLTVVLLVCLETVLLSTVSNCAKTFYMHWNTTNSIFRIDNTDHIIDVNKGNLAFEYDQVHIICPVYEPGTFDNETEKYIIYNVSKVEYETCRITNANPRIIAICDKPQKLMFFTITFRPFTPQPGGLEFLPGNDYYFISTSSKDDLHRRIGGRCSTNNMKVVFKVCCAAPAAVERPELSGGMQTIGGGGHGQTGGDVASTAVVAVSPSSGGGAGGSGASTGGSGSTLGGGSAGSGQASNAGGSGTIGGGHGSTGVSINTNIEQRTNGRNNVNGGNNNNNNNNYGQHNGEVPSTIGWPRWSHTQTQPTTSVNGQNNNNNNNNGYQQFYPPSHSVTSARPMGGKNNNNNNEATNHQNNNSNYGPSHKPTKKTNEYDKHPNEVVKNEELTYNSAAGSPSRPGGRTTSTGSTAAGWWHRLALTVLLSAVALMRYFLSWSWSLAALLFGNDEYCSSSSSSSRNSDTELRKQRRDRRRPQPRSDVSGDAVETRTALDEAAEPEPLLSSAVVQPLAAQQQQQHEQPPLQQRWLRWHRAQCERAVPQSSAGSCWKSDAERPSASGSRRPSLLPTTATTLSRSVTAAAWCQR